MKTLVKAIEKRSDVEKGERSDGAEHYADPVNQRYKLDTESQVRAAWSYINMPKNAAKYSSDDVATIKGRIKAAGKKYGIEFSDDGGDGKDKAESSLVYAAASVDLDGETPSEILFMPKGTTDITPMVGGKAKAVTVKVDASVAEVLQMDLAKRLNDPVRPYAGFDHKAGPASFLPKEFKWDEERGVILEVDWTKPGEEAVKGRGYSYFSPTFLLSGKHVAGLPGTGEVGSLTNNPAFNKEPKMKIAASADDDQTESEENTMIKVAEKLVELEVITAEQADDPEQVLHAVQGMHTALVASQAANTRLQSENTALAAKVADVQKAEATSIVEAAIAEGKIGAKDKNAIDFWTAQLTTSPETAKKVIASMQPNPALQRVIDVKVSDGKRVAQGQSAADLVQAQHLAIREVQEAHPNLSYADAFNRAKTAHPEVFPVEA